MGDYFSGPLKKSASEKDKVEFIREKFTEWNSDNNDFYDKYDKYFAAYEGLNKSGEDSEHPDDPRYHVPHVETLVDTILGQVFTTIFNQDSIVKYNPMNYESVLPARIMERVSHYQITHAIPAAFDHLYLWALDCLIGGLGFMMLSHGVTNRSYIEDKEQTFINEASGDQEVLKEVDDEGEFILDDDGQQKPVLKKELVQADDYSGLIFSKLNIRDVSTDFSNMSLQQGPVIVREWINPEDYYDLVEMKGYTDYSEADLEKLITEKTTKERGEDDTENTDPESERKISILHYFGKGWMDVGGTKKIVLQKISIFETTHEKVENKILKEESVPFIPVYPLKYKPVKNELAGRGVVAQIYDLNEYEDAMYNAMILNVSHIIHKGYKISTNAGLANTDQLDSKPGQVIFAEHPELIEEIVHSPLPADAYNMQGQTYQYMQDVTAAQDIVQGMESRATAPTTASILDSNAKRRLDLYVFRMLREAITSLGNGITQGFQTWFKSDDKVTAVLTDDEINKFKDINTEGMNIEGNLLEVTMDVLQNGKFYATTAITALDGDKKTKQQDLLQLIQITQGAVWETGRTNEETGRPVLERINTGYLVKQLMNEQGREDLKSIVIEFDKPEEEQPPGQEGGGEAPPAQQDQTGPATMAEATNIDEASLA